MYKVIRSDIYYDDDGELDIDYYSQAHGGITTHKGKNASETPYLTSADKLLNGHSVYSVYAFTGDRYVDIFKDIKKGKMRKDLYLEWVEYTARYIWSEILFDNRPDLIVTPESSSSLADDMAAQVSKMSKIPVIYGAFKKNPVDKITVEIPADLSVSDATLRAVEKVLNQIKQRGKFESKMVPKRFLKFFRNVYAGDEGYSDDIKGKKVVVIDDSMTSKATMINIFDVCDYTYEAAESYGVTIFKKSGSR